VSGLVQKQFRVPRVIGSACRLPFAGLKRHFAFTMAMDALIEPRKSARLEDLKCRRSFVFKDDISQRRRALFQRP